MTLFFLLNPEPGTIAKRVEADTSPGPEWVEMTEPEFAAWLALQPPPPPPPEPAPDADWLGFAGWLFRFSPMAEAMTAARVSTSDQGEPATTALPAAMQEARLNENYPAWAATWGQFLLASGMSIEPLTEIVGKAAECNLPPEFIAALQPQLPGGEG